jgi:hypothetical protein
MLSASYRVVVRIARWVFAVALLFGSLLVVPTDASAHGSSTAKNSDAVHVGCTSICDSGVEVTKLPNQGSGCAGEQGENCAGLLWCSGTAVSPSVVDQLPPITPAARELGGAVTLPRANLLLGLFRPPRA